eukprot:UN02041
MNDTINKAKKRLEIIKQHLSQKSIYIQPAQQQDHNMSNCNFSIITYTRTFVHNGNNDKNNKDLCNVHYYPTPKSDYTSDNISTTHKMEKTTKITFDSVPDQYFCLLCKKQGDHWIMNCPKKGK